MIVVFGSIGLDLTIGLPALPRLNETFTARSGRARPGGKGANQAVAAARDGARVIMAGAVGDDGLADMALAGLRGAGVDTSRVVRVAGPTGFSCIAATGSGGVHVATASNANLLASAAQVEDALLTPSTTVVVQMATDPVETAVLIRRARARGARVLLNLSPTGILPAEALRSVNLLVVGQKEAAWLGQRLATGGNAASLHAALEVDVVRSLSTEGVEAATRAGQIRVGAHDLELVDTMAAGDCLAGVLAAALDRGLDLEPALHRANAAASICCTRPDTQDSLPYADETDSFLRNAAVTMAL